ncbi:hypothetical protein BN1318_390027 [Staphylococcus capitis]|nr:hypothetical protein BN1318_390027 [Staphylococcus capitis]
MNNNLIKQYIPKKYQRCVLDFYKDIDGDWLELKLFAEDEAMFFDDYNNVNFKDVCHVIEFLLELGMEINDEKK